MIKNKKVFRIDENEKARILGMHIDATNSQYLTEQVTTVEGTLMDAVDGFMMSDMMKMIKDPSQVFVIASKDGNVETPNPKMLKTTDKIVFNGRGRLVVHPKNDIDAAFMIQPDKGKITLFRGA